MDKSALVSEVKVTIKDEDTTISEQFLVYEPFTISSEDPTMLSMVKQTRDKVVGSLVDPDIIIRIKMTLPPLPAP